jgi:site-specific recombinase XerD
VVSTLPDVVTAAAAPARAEVRRDEYVQAEEAARRNLKADATHRAYESDWQDFTAWCQAEDRNPLPAAPETVMDYVTWAAAVRRLHASTITRRLSGIAHHHGQALDELERAGDVDPDVRDRYSPTRQRRVRDHWRSWRMALAEHDHDRVAERKARALRVEHLRAIVAGMDRRRRRDARDRLLLLLGFLCQLRRSELVALDVADVAEVPGGLEVRVRTSKTDREGHGEVFAVPPNRDDPALCPVRALHDWLAFIPAASALFPTEGGRGARLTDRTVASVVRGRAEAAGVDPDRMSGHSLRRGGITFLLERDVPERKVQKRSRHRTREVFLGYVEEAELWRDDAMLKALAV